MKQTLFISVLFLATVACQKDISPVETSISPEKSITLKQTVVNDPLLIESCEATIQAQDILFSQTSKNNFSPEDMKKIDMKTIKSDNELIKAFESIGFQDAEQYVRLRKKQQDLTRQLHQKYPELAKISLQEWNEIVSEGLKKAYASQGRTYYGMPEKQNQN